ncbi:MAG: guanylate kinase [Oscillospiraceae bacterium]|nr:guanylate kinase [Oscillospiraceae bacterium]MDY4191852.1 guanylate kinase [Oscillospiraceae bacterium]
MNKKGRLIVCSGPSGVGKGTIVRRYVEEHPGVELSVSATTRGPRPGEEEGVHYYFISREQFEEKIAGDGMLEYASFAGNYYGTPRDKVEQALSRGRDVILEIEVQGAMKVKARCPEALLVFIMPPSFEVLRRRLSGRGTEDAATVARRLSAAAGEMEKARGYDYIVVNDDLEEALADFGAVITAAKCSIHDMKYLIDEVQKDAQTCNDANS